MALGKISRPVLRNITWRNASALFIPGNKATESYSFLSPILDFDERFSDMEKLAYQLKCRKMSIDVYKIRDSWEFYKSIDQQRHLVERQREELAEKIKELKKAEGSTKVSKKPKGSTKELKKPEGSTTEPMKLEGSIEEQQENTEGSTKELRKINGSIKEPKIDPSSTVEPLQKIGSIDELKTRGAILRQDLRLVKEQLWNLEETVIVNVLNLPNDLDDKTPIEPVVLRTNGRRTPGTSKSHVELGLERNLLEFLEPLHYYLSDEAALMELAATKWAAEYFSDTIRVSGTDFARDFVIEASGMDHLDPLGSFILDHSNHDDKVLGKLHLVGGSSLPAFLSLHTKQLINPKSLPLRYHSVGRKFTPTVGKTDLGLFGVCQSTTLDCFSIAKSLEEFNAEFSRLVDVITRIYDDLGVHYRIVLRAAHELKPWESLKISFELWSRFQQDYVEVGHLSTHGNFFSKRLLIAYQTNRGREYPFVLHGTVLSVPRLIGCCLEDGFDFVPNAIKSHM